MAGKGMKAHNKAQKDKAIAKRAAAATAAAGKPKVQVKKAVMVEEKVERANISKVAQENNVKVPETVQENNVQDIVEIGADACEVGMIIAQDEEEVTLSDSKPAPQDIVLSDAVSMSAAVYEDVPVGTDTIIIIITEELPAKSSFVMPDIFTEYDVMMDAHLANLGTPMQFLKRTEIQSLEAHDKVLYCTSENQHETFTGPARAIDDNGFECIGFRIKDTVEDTPAMNIVLSVDQLFAMFKNQRVEIFPIAGATKTAQPLEVIEKDIVSAPIHPLSTIAEEDSATTSPRSGNTSEHEDSSKSSVASTVEDTDLFSRSVTPFSETAEKQKPVVRLPSSAGSSSSRAFRTLDCTAAGKRLYRDAIMKDSNIPFDPATKIAKITVRHNVGEAPTHEQIQAAFVFTCPDETLETFASQAASPVNDPAIVSFKEKKPDLQAGDQVHIDAVDPAILSATVKKQDIIDPAILSASVKQVEIIDSAILISKVKELSPTAVVFTPSGQRTPTSPISLKEGSEIIKAALGIVTQNTSRRTSDSVPTPKDASGPHTPDTSTFQASLKNAILPEHCEKTYVPVAVNGQQVTILASPLDISPIQTIDAPAHQHSTNPAVLPEHCNNEFVPAKQQNTNLFVSHDAGAGAYDYRDAAPGQYYPEQVYAQYQQPYVYAQYQQPYVYAGAGGNGYSPYDGVPEYYQLAWDAVQYGMH